MWGLKVKKAETHWYISSTSKKNYKKRQCLCECYSSVEFVNDFQAQNCDQLLNVYEETIRKGRTLHLSGSTFQTHSCGSVHGWVTLLQIPPAHPVQTGPQCLSLKKACRAHLYKWERD